MNDKPISDLNRTPFKKREERILVFFSSRFLVYIPKGRNTSLKSISPSLLLLHPMTIGMKNGNHLDGKPKRNKKSLSLLSALQ